VMTSAETFRKIFAKQSTFALSHFAKSGYIVQAQRFTDDN